MLDVAARVAAVACARSTPPACCIATSTRRTSCSPTTGASSSSTSASPGRSSRSSQHADDLRRHAGLRADRAVRRRRSDRSGVGRVRPRRHPLPAGHRAGSRSPRSSDRAASRAAVAAPLNPAISKVVSDGLLDGLELNRRPPAPDPRRVPAAPRRAGSQIRVRRDRSCSITCRSSTARPPRIGRPPSPNVHRGNRCRRRERRGPSPRASDAGRRTVLDPCRTAPARRRRPKDRTEIDHAAAAGGRRTGAAAVTAVGGPAGGTMPMGPAPPPASAGAPAPVPAPAVGLGPIAIGPHPAGSVEGDRPAHDRPRWPSARRRR